MESVESKSPVQYVAGFFKKAWIPIVVVLVAALFAVLGLYIYEQVQVDKQAKAMVVLEQLDALVVAYEALPEGDDRIAKESEIKALADKIVLEQPSSFYAQKALFHLANVSFGKKDYAGALSLFEAVEQNGLKNYLSALSVFNAAVCAEQTGDLDKALSLFGKIVTDYSTISAEVPRSLMNQARLYEAKKDYKLAGESYTRVSTEYPESDWTKIAKDRIIFLKIQGLL